MVGSPPDSDWDKLCLFNSTGLQPDLKKRNIHYVYENNFRTMSSKYKVGITQLSLVLPSAILSFYY